MENREYQKLYAELSEFEHDGVHMSLGSYQASPMQIVSAYMVKEDKTYMRDYVWDEKGYIREVTFHNIKES